MQLNINPDNVKTIQNRTEGWVAGLQMAALSLGKQTNVSGHITSFGGNHIHLSDYFMEEVIDRQPDHIQFFLYETAILDRMCASLCDAVVCKNNSAQILEQIYKANLFIVPLDEQGKWYRYHHLFAELLMVRLEKLDNHRLEQSHLRASLWFETHQYADEAISHAMSAKDMDRVADMMEKFGADYLYRGKRKTVYRWLSLLPEALIKNHIIFSIVHAWVIYPEKTNSTYRKVKERLKDAEMLFSQHDPEKRISKYFTNQQIQGFIMALKVMLAREEGKRPEKIFELCGQAMKNLGDGDRTLKGTVLLNIGLTHVTTGEFEKAKSIIDDVRVMEEGSDNFYAIASAAYFTSWIDFVQGRLKKASSVCEKTLSSIRSVMEVHIPIVDCLDIFRSHIWMEQNRQNKVDKVLTASIESMKVVKEWGFLLKGLTTLARLKMAKKEPISQILPILDDICDMEKYRESAKILAASLKIRVLILYKDSRPNALKEAALCASDNHVELKFYPLYKKHFQYEEWHLAAQFALVRLMITQHRIGHINFVTSIQDVLTYLDKRLKQQMEMGFFKRVVEIHIMKTMAWDVCKQTDEAMKSLRSAIFMAEPERYVRLFLEEGEPMKRLLKKMAANGDSPEYVGFLLNAFKEEDTTLQKPVQRSSPEPLIEPLSEREFEVLRLVAEGLSNQEIARQLFVSEGTIKKHNYNIFSKLQVNKRTQAVASAKLLGII